KIHTQEKAHVRPYLYLACFWNLFIKIDNWGTRRVSSPNLPLKLQNPTNVKPRVIVILNQNRAIRQVLRSKWMKILLDLRKNRQREMRNATKMRTVSAKIWVHRRICSLRKVG